MGNEQTPNEKKWTSIRKTVIWCLFAAVVIGIATLIPKSPSDIGFIWLAVVSAICTIVGLGITIWQVTLVRLKAEQIAIAIEESRSRLISRISLSEVGECKNLAVEVISLTQRKEHVALVIRLRDLCSRIVALSESKDVMEIISNSDMLEYQRVVQDQLQCLDNMLLTEVRHKKYSPDKLIQYAEDLRNKLNKVEHRIKYK